MVNPLNGSSMSGNLQRPHTTTTYYSNNNNRWFDKQQLQQQLNDNFDDSSLNELPGGEQYYSSPWHSRQPLVSPAKVFRNEKLRQQQQPSSAAAPTGHSQSQTQSASHTQSHSQQQQASGRLQQPASVMPILVIKNQWKPSGGNSQARDSSMGHQAQNNNSPLEYEELIPVGPPQMMPVYQTPNGQLHMAPPGQQSASSLAQSPPPPPPLPLNSNQAENRENANLQSGGESSLEHEESLGNTNHNNEASQVDLNTNNQQHRNQAPPTTFRPVGGQRLTSPAVKGKQQLQTARPPAAAGQRGGAY